MLTWCMAHPWMTLTIAILALIVLDNAVANISNAIRARKQDRMEDVK